MSLLESYVFGLILGIAIGPIALLILNVSLQHGARSGLACAAGATTADLLFAAVAFVLAAELVPLLQAHQLLLQRIAAVVLLLFALHMLWQLRQPTAKQAQPRDARHYYRNTLLLTLVNPRTVLAFASYATRLNSDGNNIVALSHAFIAAAGTGTVAVSLVVGAQGLRQLLVSPRWLWGLNALSGIGILLFAIRGWVMTLA